MSHTIYHTEGFVLRSSFSGEANKYLLIYTEDYGLVGATAQGIRHLKSKLRYSLQDLSYSNISLVRGKDVWRITSAESHVDNKSITDNLIRTTLSRVFALVRRLVHGEEKDARLFGVLKNGYLFLQHKGLNEQEISNLEIVLILQILNVLGYLDAPEKYLQFIKSDIFSTNLLSEIDEVKNGAINVINDTLGAIDL